MEVSSDFTSIIVLAPVGWIIPVVTSCQPLFLLSETSIFSGLTPTVMRPLLLEILLGNGIEIPPQLSLPFSMFPSNKLIPGSPINSATKMLVG